MSECAVGEAEKRAQDPKFGERFVDYVLVGAGEGGRENPVEIDEVGGKDYVDVLVGFLVDAGGCPCEVCFTVCDW